MLPKTCKSFTLDDDNQFTDGSESELSCNKREDFVTLSIKSSTWGIFLVHKIIDINNNHSLHITNEQKVTKASGLLQLCE